MRISSLKLTNFRNIDSADLHLHPRLTILLGRNGMGKTNVLEAIHLLSFPRSFRNHKDELLKQWEQDFCRVEGIVEIDDTAHTLVYFYDRSKKLQLDGQSIVSSSFVGQFLSVLFAPEEVDLLAGTPGRRRAFLDAHLSQLSPTYFTHLLHYNKVIKQRNKLLSKPHTSVQELEYWNEQQVEHGSTLIESRVAAIDDFNTLLSPTLRLRYTSSLISQGDSIQTTFQHKQASLLERERIVGHTLIGPHRDDWVLEEVSPTIRDLGTYGSRGEQRMAVIALKQAQLMLIHQKTEQRAILLLDDVLSELDADHQKQLLSSLGEQQTILTTASLSDVPSSLLQDATVYHVEHGTIVLST